MEATEPPLETATILRNPIFARIRVANSCDAPHVHKLIHQLVAYHGLTHLFSATESSLSAALFNSPPFHSFTVFLLEVSLTPFPADEPPITARILNLDHPVVDPESEEFRSAGGEGKEAAVVVGFVLFYPRYGMMLGKAGFHIEGMHVRKCYRKKGFGKMLLSAVAAQAVKMGYGEVDWVVFSWNLDAIGFYKKMGAEVFEQTKTCRLTLDALQACASF